MYAMESVNNYDNNGNQFYSHKVSNNNLLVNNIPNNVHGNC